MPRKERKEEERARSDEVRDPRGVGAAPDTEAVDTAEFEVLLERRQRALWNDVQRELEKSRGQQFKDLIQQGADPDDRAMADLLTTLNASEVTRDVEEFRAVQMALGRIHSGSYGICQSCGRPIGVERLRAIPETPFCVECASRLEKFNVETPTL